MEVFFTLADVREARALVPGLQAGAPHSALGDHPPEIFAAGWKNTATPRLEPSPGRAEKARSGQLTGDTHLSLLSAKKAG